MDLAALDLNPGQSGQVLAGCFVAFLSRRPGRQTHQGGRKAFHQSQRFIQRKTPPSRVRMVEIIAPKFHQSENGMHLHRAGRMDFFAAPAGVVRDQQVSLGVELLEQKTTIFEQSLTQPQFKGFAVANTVLA